MINLRTLNPLDEDTLAESVRRTHHAMVVTEAVLSFGPGAEIAARLQETCFDHLEEPVLRIAGEDVPIPVAPNLERACVPDAELICAAACKLLRRGPQPDWD